MTGRNNHPKKDGRRATPSRLDQFGEEFAQDNDMADLKPAQKAAAKGACDNK
jgi:hypothetical protein